MTLGVRALLLAAAVVLFVIAAVDDNFDLLSLGLACLAAGFLVSDMGWDRRLTGDGRTGPG